MAPEDEIKTALSQKTLIVGTRTVVRELKSKHVRSVFVASNAPTEVAKDLQHYSEISKTPLHHFNGTGKQLGTFLGKPFSVATVAIRAGEHKK